MMHAANVLSRDLEDDVDDLLELGILRIVRGEYAIANPIYREVIPRALASVDQAASIL